jgi:Fe-S cluster assembly protein SufD
VSEQLLLSAARGVGAEAGGPAWLAELRERGLANFARLGIPTTRDEDWHYTNPAVIAERAWAAHPAAGASSVQAADLAPYTFGQPDWPTMVFLNGRFAPELSNLRDLPAGVRVTDLATALEEEPELVQRHAASAANMEQHAFTALNTGALGHGVVIHVAKEMVAEVPVHVIYASDAGATDVMMQPRMLIVADRHSTATVIESWVGLTDARYFNNAVTEAVLADGATINHLKVQREGRGAMHVGSVHAHQERDSHFISFSFAIGAGLSRTNIHTVLDGEGAGSTLNGLYMIDGEQVCDNQTRIEHAQPNCFSREVYKGLLDGHSRGVFNGKVYVHPIAQKTDGKQENNNMLLSPYAHVDTKPELEIFADDVRCTHGATVGRIDETALFYMKSRGVSADAARDLLVYAFAADVLETIEQTEVREALETLTLERFAGVADSGVVPR